MKADPGPLEKDIEKKVCRYAEKLGMYQRKFSSPGNRSVPDRLFICRGRTFYIEFKRKGMIPTLAQLKEHQSLRKAGADVYVVDSVIVGKALIYSESNNCI